MRDTIITKNKVNELNVETLTAVHTHARRHTQVVLLIEKINRLYRKIEGKYMQKNDFAICLPLFALKRGKDP